MGCRSGAVNGHVDLVLVRVSCRPCSRRRGATEVQVNPSISCAHTAPARESDASERLVEASEDLAPCGDAPLVRCQRIFVGLQLPAAVQRVHVFGQQLRCRFAEQCECGRADHPDADVFPRILAVRVSHKP